MPVRSLNSSVIKWPDKQRIEEEIRDWATRIITERADILRVGFFGSYARDDWGVGSDLDIIMVIENSSKPFEKRAAEFDTTNFSPPVDLLIYTEKEWSNLEKNSFHFFQRLTKEVIWLHPRETV